MPERRFYTPHGESGRQSTVVLFLLLLGALWAFALSWVYVERDRDLEAKQTQLLQLISALSSQTFSLFRLMETGLFAAEHWISTHRAARPWEDPAFIALVKRLESTSGGILSFYVVDEEGGLYYVPNEAEGPRMNVSDRDYFLAQSQAESRGLYVGKTITSRVSGKQVIPVGFPVSNASSGVSMLVGVIDLQSIIMLHDKQRPLPSGTIAILRSDGTVLSHAPYQESLIGKNIADSLSYQQHIASSSKGIYYSQSSATDSVPQDISFEKLGSVPLTVFVTSAREDALENWRRNAAMVLTLAAMASLLSLPALLKLLRLMRDNAIAREKLHQLATTDGLTGLMNRRAFLHAAKREFERSKRHARPLCVVMADLDHFKVINDTYGHATGDSVLRAVGAAIAMGLRSGDISGRIGGEEFCLVLPETSLAEAMAVAERLQQVVCLPSPQEGLQDICPSFSMGITQMLDRDEDFELTLARSDANLYLAKKNGRNCIHAQ